MSWPRKPSPGTSIDHNFSELKTGRTECTLRLGQRYLIANNQIFIICARHHHPDTIAELDLDVNRFTGRDNGHHPGVRNRITDRYRAKNAERCQSEGQRQ